MKDVELTKAYVINKTGFSVEYINNMNTLLFFDLYETLRNADKN